MRKIKSKKKIFIPICLVLVIGILCGIFIPRFTEKTVKQNSLVSKTQKGFAFDGGYKPYVTAGDNTLYVNEDTSAVAIATKDNKVVFNSHSEDAAKSKLASVISLTLRDRTGNSYLLNSTDNSVGSGEFEVASEDKNTVTITFNVSDADGNLYGTVPVKFSSYNNAFKVEIDTNEVVLEEAYSIEKISILPGLFSEKSPTGECFYTVPDGCGAQVDLTALTQEAYSKTLDVYGSDITFGEYSQGATLPCFSITKNNVMLTTVIEDGDALSSLYVKHHKETGGDLYNTFTVTPYGKVDGKLVKGTSYNGVISQLYYLTEDGEDNYNTVSAIIRDNLTDRGYLPTEMSDAFVDFPFFITAIGSENGKKNDIYTTFENGAEMVALLKSRGVRSVALRFAGAGEKGLNSGARYSDNISEVLGGKDSYNELCNLAVEKNSTVWYDVNLSVTPSKNGENKTDLYSDLRMYLAKESVNSSVGSYNSTYNNISSVYKFMSEFEAGNVCINDLSYLLYTDILGKTDRQTALNNLKEKIASLSVGGGLMLSQPAVYLMNQADAVFSLPQSATLSEFDGVTTVPLLQMTLHGTVCYGSEPINLAANNTDAVLKAVEYGASPSFIFTHSNCDVLDYGVYSTQTAKFYSSVKRMLPLMDMKITSHEQVVSGVYKITYDYSKVVYVNYNPSVVEVNGILVSAKDFVII